MNDSALEARERFRSEGAGITVMLGRSSVVEGGYLLALYKINSEPLF